MTHDKGPKQPECLSLTPWHMKHCKKWGEGNASNGARIAIEAYEKAQREQDEKPRHIEKEKD